MHPVLIHIPIAWLCFGGAGIALLFAIYAFTQKLPGQGVFAALLAVAAAALKFTGPALFQKLNGRYPGLEWPSEIPIYSYGVMLGLSLVVGWYLTLGLAEKDGLPKEEMANNYVVTAIAAVVGSRVLYIVTNLDQFTTLGSLFSVRSGGLVAYGGFLGGWVGSFVYLKKNRLPLLPWADVAVPSLASGLMITRIGCYLFGCDFGKTLGPNAPGWLKFLGTFPHWKEGTLEHGDGSPAWMQHLKAGLISHSDASSLPVHPTQLYESAVGLTLLVILLLARRNQKFRGQIVATFFFGYGVLRYLLEIIRADDERGEIPPSLPEHILIPAGAVILAIGWVIGFSRAVKNVALRRVTQVLAFVPAVLLYVKLKPDAFDVNMEYSTSQFIAITTGFAAAVAFGILYKAAEEHPEAAMALHLPKAMSPALAGGPSTAGSSDEDEDENDEEPKPKAAPAESEPAKAGGTKRAKKPSKGGTSDEVEEALSATKGKAAEIAARDEKGD